MNALNKKPNKRIFKPNLNVERKKQTIHVVETVKQGTFKERRRIIPKHQAARYITTNGIFSEDAPKIKRESNHSYQEHEASYSISKPKLTTTTKRISKKHEAGVVNNLLEVEESTADKKIEHQPILLPLSNNQHGFFTNVSMQKPKEEPYVAPLTFNKKIHSQNNPSCSIIKLPVCLPAKGFNQDGNTTDCTMEHLQEGKIGNIIIRKSGRMEMVFGSTTYEIEHALPAPYREDLMCVPKSEGTDRQKMVNLGPIREKFVLTPCWDQLLCSKET